MITISKPFVLIILIYCAKLSNERQTSPITMAFKLNLVNHMLIHSLKVFSMNQIPAFINKIDRRKRFC